jgi:hypothetical protein
MEIGLEIGKLANFKNIFSVFTVKLISQYFIFYIELNRTEKKHYHLNLKF